MDDAGLSDQAGAAVVLVRWGARPGAGVARRAPRCAWLNFRWLKQGVTALVRLSTAQAELGARPGARERLR